MVKKNIMLTLLFACVILILVGCKNGYTTIKEVKGDENADKSQEINESLIENTSSRRT